MAQKINYLDDFLDYYLNSNMELLEQTKKSVYIPSFVLKKYYSCNNLKDVENNIKTDEKLNKSLLKQYQLAAKENNYQVETLTTEGLNAALNRYILILRRHTERIKTEEDIIDHLKKGYELIHRIRELLTGQKITYTILYSDDKKNKNSENMWEAHLTLEELLSSFTTLSKDASAAATQDLTKAFSLNIPIWNEDEFLEKVEEANQEN